MYFQEHGLAVLHDVDPAHQKLVTRPAALSSFHSWMPRATMSRMSWAMLPLYFGMALAIARTSSFSAPRLTGRIAPVSFSSGALVLLAISASFLSIVAIAMIFCK